MNRKSKKEALIAQALEEGDEEQANTIRQYYDELDNKQDIVISNLELPEQDEYDSYTEKNDHTVRQYLRWDRYDKKK